MRDDGEADVFDSCAQVGRHIVICCKYLYLGSLEPEQCSLSMSAYEDICDITNIMKWISEQMGSQLLSPKTMRAMQQGAKVLFAKILVLSV